MFLPVDILWIRGISDRPIMRVKFAAVWRTLGLPTTVTAMTLASVEVFQNPESKHPSKQAENISRSRGV